MSLLGTGTSRHLISDCELLTLDRHRIFLELWKGRIDFTGVIQSPLIGFMKLIDFADTDHAGYK